MGVMLGKCLHHCALLALEAITCLICAAALIDRDVAGADWEPDNELEQLQDVVRQQVLIVV